MKWIFFMLFGLNLLLASLQWWNMREADGQQSYVPQPGIKQLTLLQERSIKTTATESMAEADQQCELVGPITDKSRADSLLKLLKIGGVRASLVVQEMKRAPGYWVYYGPVASESARQEKWREFQSKGIDSYLITSGKLKGAISVGVFENIDSAQRMKQKMSGHGYQSKLSEIEKSSEVYWLLIYEPYLIENKKKIEEALNAFEVRPEKRQIFCKSVASEKQFP